MTLPTPLLQIVRTPDDTRRYEIADAVGVVDRDAGTSAVQIDARITDGIDRDQIVRRTYDLGDEQARADLADLLAVVGVSPDALGHLDATALRGRTYVASPSASMAWTDLRPAPVLQQMQPRIVIEIRQDLVGVVNDAEAALAARDDRLYVRAGALVRVITPDERLPPALAKIRARPPKGATTIDVVRPEHLRERMATVAWWIARRRQRLVDQLPPDWAVRALHARGEWSLRPLDRVVENPTLRPDGSVIELAGYDAATGILYAPLARYPRVLDTPSRDDARRAVAQIRQLIADFPFAAPSDEVAALALSLTIAARSAISGPVPLFAPRAPTPGTGKGRLVEAITIAITGRAPTLIPPIADDDAEWRKSILALALAGYPVVAIDNVVGTLGSPSLAAALTTGSISGRILGGSRTATVPIAAVWTATGNNLAFAADLGRRVIPIDLDAGVERPEERTNFRIPDLLGHAREHHPHYITAALTILRAYYVAGCPPHGLSRYGSYECWDDLIRGALIWAGCADPCDGRRRIQADSDVDALTIGQVLTAWHAVYGSTAATIASAITASRSDVSTLHDALMSACSGCEPTARIVAVRFRAWRGRIVGGLRLVPAGTVHGGVMSWRVEEVAE